MIAKKITPRLIFLSLIAAFGAVFTLLSGFYLLLSPKLPEVDTLRQINLQTPLRVYSSDNVLIGQFGEKRRSPISIEQVPPQFLNAILAAEDDRFYSHHGVDIKGLLRATTQLLQSGQIQTGGSTITMQVARNFFLNNNQTFSRKFNEILLALQIERELTKNEILELYINKIYLGNRAYGIQAAAQTYYGTNIQSLTLAQLAMIAGLPKAPSAYNPLANPERALIRRNWILGRMLQLGHINQAIYDEYVDDPITASYHGSRLGLDAPYIAEMARKSAVELFGEEAYTDGYEVFTTIDSRLQLSAQQAVIHGLTNYDQRHGYRGPETNLVKLKPNTTTEHQVITNESLAAWQEKLSQIPTYGELAPAAVIDAKEQTLTALLSSGEIVTINWDNGPAQARPHINEDRRGQPPTSVSDFLQLGDVIRVNRTIEGSWHLSQVPKAQAALVALAPNDGAIKALVGGFDFNQSHFNRATQAERQPGSNFKPFIYTAALESGFTPASIINDAPIVFEDSSLESTWRPENDSGKFFGPTRLRQALYKSRNLVSIRILQSMGIPNAISLLGKFGFPEAELPHDLSLALGSYAMTPIQVATGYAVFANGGYKVDPYLISSIRDVKGNTVYTANPATVCPNCLPPLSSKEDGQAEIAQTTHSNPAPKILDDRVAYLMNDILQDVIRKGTGTKAQALGRHDLAGKTGTTNGPKDAWFSGYNHHMVATTWLGFDQNLPLGRREYGGSAALPIWIEFMQAALAGVPEQPRKQPDGLITVRIDPETGLRADANNPRAIFETFRVENIPAEEGNSELPAPGKQQEALPADIF